MDSIYELLGTKEKKKERRALEGTENEEHERGISEVVLWIKF